MFIINEQSAHDMSGCAIVQDSLIVNVPRNLVDKMTSLKMSDEISRHLEFLRYALPLMSIVICW